jgi:hypothetical protein
VYLGRDRADALVLLNAVLGVIETSAARRING